MNFKDAIKKRLQILEDGLGITRLMEILNNRKE